MLGERVRTANWVAIAVAIVGIAVMVQEGIAGGRAFGNVMALTAAATGAFYYVTLRAGRRIDMMPTVCVAGVLAAIVTGVIATDLTVISGHDLFYSLLLGAGQVGLGMMIYTLGARHVRAAELALLSLAEFIVSPILGWLIVGEIPSAATLVGGAIILGAVGGLAVWSLREAGARATQAVGGGPH